MAFTATDFTSNSTRAGKGLIQRIWNLISIVVPTSLQKRAASVLSPERSAPERKAETAAPARHSVKRASSTETAHTKRASSSRRQTSAKKAAAPKHKAASHHASASRKSTHSKTRTNHSHNHKAPKAESHLGNPKDVIPERHEDPAHSSGHRKIHIEKELHH